MELQPVDHLEGIHVPNNDVGLNMLEKIQILQLPHVAWIIVTYLEAHVGLLTGGDVLAGL